VTREGGADLNTCTASPTISLREVGGELLPAILS